MIDFVFGKKANPQAVQFLVDSLKQISLNGTLYIGYPIFDVDDDSLLTDALLVTKEHGVVAFDLTTNTNNTDEEIEEYQDDIYRGLFKRFLTEKKLVIRRKLSFEIEVFSFRNLPVTDGDIAYSSPESIIADIEELDEIDDEKFTLINAAIQKTSVLKPQKKRKKVASPGSMGAIMKEIEKEIANLDKWQKKAAIESPDKPQRIRGLAGCGKTIILAMKAAYLHAYNEDLTIAVTFQSRALYQQFNNLIEKFYFEHVKDEPDMGFLKIRHAWGSNSEIGLYSEICSSLGIEPLSFNVAASRYGRENAFDGACTEALEYAQKVDVTPIYDYVLIDEAQDFPVSFFKLVYKFTKDSKKIVWAYDELQNLGNFTMLPPDDLFGCNSEGTPLVSLVNTDGAPKQDNMLPICYRNPPWTLTLALALGLGIYRDDSLGLVRMFSKPEFWTNIGYELVGGQLKLGERGSLKRSSDRNPEYFERLLKPESAILHSAFSTEAEQAAWAAKEIEKNITTDELEHSDILVIFPSAYRLNTEASYLMYELRERGIDCHIVGSTSSRDVVFKENSIAITHIYRAKGNEAPMVYTMNSNFCYSGLDLGKKRNTLFTAITRAKAWVRILGVGEGMEKLSEEIQAVIDHKFVLDFKYPNKEELDTLDSAYQDKSEEEKQEIYEGFGKIKHVKKLLDSGELSKEDLPQEIRDLFLSED